MTSDHDTDGREETPLRQDPFEPGGALYGGSEEGRRRAPRRRVTADEGALTGATATPSGRAGQEVRRELVEFLKMVALFILLFVALRQFVVEGYEVQGSSMLPNLRDRERILVFKLPHILDRTGVFDWLNPIDAGDIVVFESPDDPDKRYVKRVIARGPERPRGNTVDAGTGDAAPEGTRVHIEDGGVYVNNQRLDEAYLPGAELEHSDAPMTVVLEPGEYFVLGDNRRDSKDSRRFGAIEDESVIGVAVVRFWPLSEFGLLQ